VACYLGEQVVIFRISGLADENSILCMGVACTWLCIARHVTDWVDIKEENGDHLQVATAPGTWQRHPVTATAAGRSTGLHVGNCWFDNGKNVEYNNFCLLHATQLLWRALVAGALKDYFEVQMTAVQYLPYILQRSGWLSHHSHQD
jgi:hypothetical protein